MKQILTWNGKAWVESAIENLPLGVQYIKIVERYIPGLDDDILTSLKGALNAKNSRVQEDTRPDEQNSRKEE